MGYWANIREVLRHSCVALSPLLPLMGQLLGEAKGLWIGTALACAVIIAALLRKQRLALSPPPQTAQSLNSALERAISERALTHKNSLCLALQLDDLTTIKDIHGVAGAETVCAQAMANIAGVLRDADTAQASDDGPIIVVIGSDPRLDLEAALQIANRIQTAIAQPYLVDNATVLCSASIGFALLSRVSTQTPQAYQSAAITALMDAKRQGPGAVRAYSPELTIPTKHQMSRNAQVFDALESGAITAWFQPQVRIATGEISGFEALARWHHPNSGLIPPSDFLPTLENAGLMERLNERMLRASFCALKDWDQQGFNIPHVSVNFASDDLRNPKLVERIEWELDRQDLSADRLCVEVLETVMAGSGDDIIHRNLARLSDIGCLLDLDDFGTGHASIAAIRRFGIDRLKIDRSFITKVDSEAAQSKMVRAIISMANELGIEALAEGVETLSEHAKLAQIGCHHVQGFGLAKPMPLEETHAWIRAHKTKVTNVQSLTQRFA